MKIVLDTEVHQAANGVWLTFMSPREVSMFGQPKSTRGQRSIVLVDSAEFHSARRALELDADAITVLNSQEIRFALHEAYRKAVHRENVQGLQGHRVITAEHVLIAQQVRQIGG